MSCATNRPVDGDKLTQFLQQTLGTLAEGYVVSLAELSSLKEPRHQKELLNLKEDLKVGKKWALEWGRQILNCNGQPF